IRQILQQYPNHPEATHYLAYVANATGNMDAAQQLLLRAIELDPHVAIYHKNLGAVYAAKRQHDLAAAAFTRSLQLNPNDPETVLKYGLVLEEQNQFDKAMECYQKAAALAPQYAEAHCNVGDILARQGQLESSLAHYDQAIRCNPNLAEAYANRGTILDKLNREDEAIADMSKALQLNPNMVHALRAMGVFCYRRQDYEQAIKLIKRAVELNPNYALAFSSLSIVYLRTGRCELAVEACKRSIELEPNFIDPHVNLGLALTDLGRHDEALAAYEQALKVDPDCVSTRANRAIVHLLRGNLEQGFEDYHFRWKLEDFIKISKDRPAPRWEGQDLNGRKILLWHEQGFGDTIQFIRYAKLLAQQGATVIAEVQPELVSLLKNVEGVSQLITRKETPPQVDYHAPMLSLPPIFKTQPDNIPSEHAYIHPDPKLVEQWRARVAPYSGFRVGIVWCGNPFLRLDYERSVTPAQFLPIAQIDGVNLFSLQLGPGSEQGQRVPFQLIDLTSNIRNFADTAAFLAHMDLTIAVDTAVLHLSAAMGRPTWGLIQRWPDWRWQLDREDSPWYPTLRLFRQTDYRAWPPVFERVATELEKLLATRTQP
ncbi:MAG TPA: tetratricopeptide repeat protein, partial [Tepidisphaeraceae bacterium]|nr:tetratricopeptide repeat protein [Tepidisphaeraceae bacterium]